MEVPMKEQTRNFIRAMLDGMTGVGLFRKLRIPGQADQYMGTQTAEEFIESGEFQATLDRLHSEGLWQPPGDQTASRPSK
jgi:hypothetical protein